MDLSHAFAPDFVPVAEQSVQPWTPVISDTSGPIPKQPIKQQAHKTNTPNLFHTKQANTGS